MYRCATVTRAEIDQLQTIDGVVRLGHVTQITPTKIVLDKGDLPTTPGTVHIDCTADGLARRPATPVFDGNHITLQAVRTCQQVFSAAFIAHVSHTILDEQDRNQVCTPVPHPDTDIDWLRTTLGQARNSLAWGEHPELQTWLDGARLDGFSTADPAILADNGIVHEALRMAGSIIPAIENLELLLTTID